MCQKRPRTGSGPHDGPVLPVLNIKRLCQTCAKHMLKVCQTHVKRMSKGISNYVERMVKVCQKHEEHVPQARQTSAQKDNTTIPKHSQQYVKFVSKICQKYIKCIPQVDFYMFLFVLYWFSYGLILFCYLDVVVMKIILKSH